MPSIVGTLVVSVPNTASPGAVALGANVPAGANLCLAFLSGSNDAGVTLNSLSSNFTEAFTVTNHPGFTGLGVQVAVATITSTGAGKALTPAWSAGLVYGPTCTLVFLSVTDPATAIRDLDLNNSDGGTAVTLTVDSSATDIVLAYDSRYTTNSTLPGTNAGYTSRATQADYGGAATRLSQANSPGAATTAGTTVDTQYSALALVSVRDSGGGGDTTSPTLTSPSAAATGQTTATGSVTASEACTGYAVISTSATAPTAAQVIAGQMHTGAAAAASDTATLASGANVDSFLFTGLTAATTYYMHVAAVDAATNTSTVVSTTSFTTSAAASLPVLIGDAITFHDLGTSATPGAKTVNVPSNAKVIVVMLDISGYPSANSFTSLTSDCCGAFTVTTDPQNAAAMGVVVAWAAVTSTGNGKTVTPVFGGTNDFAPAGMHVFFLDDVNPADPVLAIGTAQTADGTAAATASAASTTESLVIVRDAHGATTSGAYPSLGAGFTSLATTEGAAGGLTYRLSHRIKKVTAPVNGTASATTQETLASTISVVSFKYGTAAADTTPPTLSAASGTPTGMTTATLQVTTNEAGGTLYAVVVLSSEPSPSDSQVILGQDFYGDVPPAQASGSVTSAGVLTLNVVGLNSGETYTAYFVHVDGATPANTSTVLASGGWTQPTPDTTLPILTGSITVTAVTQTTFSSECPVASDNFAVTGYEVSLDGGTSWINKGASRTHDATGMTPGAVVALRWRAYDAAGNRSTPALAASVQMEHPGVLGSTIMLTTGTGDNGPGIMYPSIRTGDESKRYYFTITTPPTNGTLDIDPDGTFVYTGTADAFSFELFENSVSLGITTATLSFGGSVSLTADATATASTSAALQAAVKLLGSAQAQATAAAQLMKTSSVTASASAQANAAANLALSKALSASAVAVASASADMGVSAVQVTANAAALASSTGALTKTVPVTAVASAVFSSTGSVVKFVNLSANAAASSTAAADFLGQTNLTAFGGASASSSANLQRQVPLSAAAAVVSISAGDVALSVSLSAVAVASAVSSASLQTQTPGLSANAEASSTSSASISVTIGLSAAAVAEMMSAASLANTVNLSAAAAASATGQAWFESGSHPLQASATALTNSTGTLTVSIPLEAVAAATADGAGLVTVSVNLTGTGAVSTSSEAFLSRTATLSADADSTTVASAQMTVFNPIATYKRFTLVRGLLRRVWAVYGNSLTGRKGI